jgi:putative FmdB family regulatory protein
MPYYQFKCSGCDKLSERVLMMADCDKPQVCECGAKLKRVYGMRATAQFKPYYDEVSKKTVRSGIEERKLMKQRGEVYFRDTKGYQKFKDQCRRVAKKPVHILMGS